MENNNQETREFTGKSLTEKLTYSMGQIEKRIGFLENRAEVVATMPEVVKKLNRKTNITEDVPREKELEAFARREALNNMSKGKYTGNIIIMSKLNEARAGRDLNEDEKKKYDKAKDANKRIEKNAEHEGGKAIYQKQFKLAHYYNCTTEGIAKHISEQRKMFDSTKSLIDGLKDVQDKTFTVKIKEARNMCNLKFDKDFMQQLDVARAALAPPAPEKKKAAGRKR